MSVLNKRTHLVAIQFRNTATLQFGNVPLVCRRAPVAQFRKTKHNKGVANMRSALFWDLTHRRMVLPYRRFGTSYRFRIQGTEKMGPIGCTETSVHHTLRRIAKERTTHLQRVESLKPRVVINVFKQVILSA